MMSWWRLGLWVALVLLTLNWVHYLVHLYRQSRFEDRRLLAGTGLGTVVLAVTLIGASGWRATPPLSSRAAIFALFTMSILGVFLLVCLTEELKSLGSLVVPVALLFLGLALLQPTAPADETLAGVGAFWSHVLLIVTAYGAFTVAFLMAVGYLRAEYQLRAKSVDGMFFTMPSLEALDRGLQRSIWIGIILLVAGILLAVLTGYVNGELSAAWLTDRNVVGTLLTGIVYGMILYVRRRTLFTNRRIAYLAVVGFIVISSLFIGMNVFADMHRFVD